MAEGRYLKMILSLYLSRGSSDFDEISCADASFDLENGHLTKIKMLHIQNGGRPPSGIF